MEQRSFDRGEPLTQDYINLSAHVANELRTLGIESGTAPSINQVATV
jgi:hypothetical protein